MNTAIGNRQSAIGRVLAPIAMLVAVLAGCGGGTEGNVAPAPASLDGTRADAPRVHYAPAVDLDRAPSEAHKRLAKLIPDQSLLKDEELNKESVKYGGWDGEAAGMITENAKDAAMPALSADYLSTGFRVVDSGENKIARQDYPQSCKLFLIQAPDAISTEVVTRKIHEKLKANGFTLRDPISAALGLTTRKESTPEGDVVVTTPNDAGGTDSVVKPGDERAATITRHVRIDHSGEQDKVYIAYTYVSGDIVMYALETETPPPVKGAEGAQLERVTDNRGSRVGARILFLVLYRLLG